MAGLSQSFQDRSEAAACLVVPTNISRPATSAKTLYCLKTEPNPVQRDGTVTLRMGSMNKMVTCSVMMCPPNPVNV